MPTTTWTFSAALPAVLTSLALAGCGAQGLDALSHVQGLVPAKDASAALRLQVQPDGSTKILPADAARALAPAVPAPAIPAGALGAVALAAGAPPVSAATTVAPGAAPANGAAAAPGTTGLVAAAPPTQPVAVPPVGPATTGAQVAAVTAAANAAQVASTQAMAAAMTAMAPTGQAAAAAIAAIVPVPGQIFGEDFTQGLERWQIGAPPGAPAAADPQGAWAVVSLEDDALPHALALADHGPLAAAQRTFYLRTQKPIELTNVEQPRLRLNVKNAGTSEASFKAVWQSADAAHPEETLVATRFDADKDWGSHEFDLSAVAGRPGRLVLIARASQGALPMLGEITVYDASKN